MEVAPGGTDTQYIRQSPSVTEWVTGTPELRFGEV
jgi:hypothetical protein